MAVGMWRMCLSKHFSQLIEVEFPDIVPANRYIQVQIDWLDGCGSLEQTFPLRAFEQIAFNAASFHKFAGFGRIVYSETHS